MWLALTLAAHGSIDNVGNDMDRILEGLDLGHKTIVESFARLMSEEANPYWGLKHVND